MAGNTASTTVPKGEAATKTHQGKAEIAVNGGSE